MGRQKPAVVKLYAGLLREVQVPPPGFWPEPTTEEKKAALGIDEIILHLASTVGRTVSKTEVSSKIDQAIVKALEGLRDETT